jgi:hypothetical protein
MRLIQVEQDTGEAVKTLLKRIISEIDSALALAIAIAMSILGLFSTTSNTVANNAILVTLAVLSLSIFRDRWQRDAKNEEQSLKLTALLDESRPIRELRKQEIGQAFADARQSTDHWTFRGGTGSYTRAVTLPECYRIAQERRSKLSIRLEILDPTDPTVCEGYANFRRSVAQPADHLLEEWTTLRAQEESYATILAACWYRKKYNQPDIAIGLTRKWSTERNDMSERYLIITYDDSVAQLIPRSSEFYNRRKVELFISLEQATLVKLEEANSVPLNDISTIKGMTRIFEALNLPLHQAVNRDRIIERAFHSKNPYP